MKIPDGPYSTIDGSRELEVSLEAPGIPVLDLRIIIRRGPDDSPDTTIGTVGTLAPNEEPTPRVDVSGILALAMSPGADATHYRLILNWTGQLGQWVVQEYDYDFVGQMLEFENPMLRMVRWHVDPRVEGMAPLEVAFR